MNFPLFFTKGMDDFLRYNGIINTLLARNKSRLARGNELVQVRSQPGNNNLRHNFIHRVTQVDGSVITERLQTLNLRNEGNMSSIKVIQNSPVSKNFFNFINN